MTLTDIIARLEAAEGPNFALEQDIAQTLVPDIMVMRQRDDDSGAEPFTYRKFTASIDDAVWLAERLLPGRSVMMGWRQTSETRPWARVGLWPDPDATGATPAIALVLATLRALQAKTGDRT
jgi:hypothetical protein